MYDIIIFDLDGTLTDSEVGIVRSIQFALSHFGIQEEASAIKRFLGPPLYDTLRTHYGLNDKDAHLCIEKYRERFVPIGMFENAPYPGIIELLQNLRSRGALLGVATMKPTIYSREILEHFEMAQYFDVISGDALDSSLSREGKNGIIRYALDTLDPERTKSAVMIGDRDQDINGANAKNIPSIGLLYGYGSRGELESAGATMMVESVEALSEYLLK